MVGLQGRKQRRGLEVHGCAMGDFGLGYKKIDQSVN
jgi:hypothetical protein